MEIEKSKVEISRTGVYYSVGKRSAERQWFCCHGYAQLADRLMYKFDRRIEIGEKVVCVEAPNRFYWKGVRGNPVATWMTSRYRLDEIRDNSEYLNKVYTTELDSDAQRVLFGFSQGGTTLWRWIHDQRPDFDIFINYAGWIPEDINLTDLTEYLKEKKLILIYGKNDEYLSSDRIDALKMIITRSKLDIEIIETNGNHSIDRGILDSIFS